MRLLITGASGYLGRHLATMANIAGARVLAAHQSHPERITDGTPFHLDLGDPNSPQRIVDLGPDAIIHAAAANPGHSASTMEQVNVEGSRYVAEATEELGCRLIHVSTDVVHDGHHAPYEDAAPANPLGNAYARSKEAAERLVRNLAPTAVIVRTSLIYGTREMDRGTAGFAQRLRAGETVKLFSNQLRQPVDVGTLIQALLKLTTTEFAGFLNVAGSQVLSRSDFGVRMLRWWGIEGPGQVESIDARSVSASIPLDLTLRLDRAQRLLDMEFPGVDDILGSARHPNPLGPGRESAT